MVMDIDHVEDPRATFEKWNVLGTDDTAILLVYVTPSGKGLKVVFKADVEKGNLIDNQHAMAKVLGVEVDESCKDASRMSFICKESDILYLNKELFTYENKEFGERYDAVSIREGHFRGSFKGTDSTDLHGFKKESENPAAENKSSDNPWTRTCSLGSSKNPCQEIKWRGYMRFNPHY